ncbi:hypothetical protein PG994_006570 [Apiospora phragmitis]|uniref:SMP domain-containing protein n=1 Tax=Apiospora phragmitis TaxID=2905665 RepID=A0ABR1VFF1_9PEZI
MSSDNIANKGTTNPTTTEDASRIQSAEVRTTATGCSTDNADSSSSPLQAKSGTPELGPGSFAARAQSAAAKNASHKSAGDKAPSSGGDQKGGSLI